MNIDESLAAFKEFKTNVSAYIEIDISESDTRSKVIDALLNDVLGWGEQHIRREEFVGTGYYDYKLSLPEFCFIIEAKKNFVDLILPKNSHRISVNSLMKGNSEVVEQIRKYSFNSGCQFGVITNGRQFVFIKIFNTDGTDWKNNICLVFDGLDEVENNFIEFYNNFSKESIAENRGFLYDLPENNVKFETILSDNPDRDRELVRNQFHGYLSPLFDDIFGELFNEDKFEDIAFIKKCFVENDDTKKNQSEIERIFSDKAPKLYGVLPIVNSTKLKNSIKAEITNDKITTRSSAPQPIIIIGSKGAGKTTFINHLFKYKFKEHEIPNHFTIYIDFRAFFETENAFSPDKLAKEIIDSILQKYSELELHKMDVLKRIYLQDIKLKTEGTWSHDKKHNAEEYEKKLADFLDESQKDHLLHLEKLVSYLIWERRKRLIVIIDNADQFEQEIQKKIFLFSNSLNKKMHSGAVISLREGYYYQWRLTPPFDAYVSNVYHITAPRYSDVLQKRIDYAIETLISANKSKIHAEDIVDAEDVTTQMIDFLSAIKNTLFTDGNSEILDYLFYTTYPNIREGLKVFKIFLTSLHTKIKDYIKNERISTEQRNVSSSIPFHEFIKSIGLQNKHYYSSSRSIIHNVFLPPTGCSDHFINVYLLKYLDKVDASNGSDKFTKVSLVLTQFASFGYKATTIKNALGDLLHLDLINTDDQFNDTETRKLADDTNIQITAKGYYYYKQLVREFQYIDLVLQDTPIFIEDYLNKLRELFPKSNENGKRNLYARIETAKKFIDYLDEHEKNKPQALIKFFGDLSAEIRNAILADIATIERTASFPLSRNM